MKAKIAEMAKMEEESARKVSEEELDEEYLASLMNKFNEKEKAEEEERKR